ncbi:MAG: SLC13 family permease [Candidatus Aminicenantaceae bacterium]
MSIWRKITIVFAFAVFFAFLHYFRPEGLSQQGQRAIAIFILCLILWVTDVIPLAITSLLAITLLPLLGVMDTKAAFSLFGNEAVFFILGAFILAAALMKTGLSTRLALFFLTRIKKTPQSLLLGVLLSSAFLSLWMPAHVVAALMFPIVLEIARTLSLKTKESSYGKALFLSLAWGAVIGGVGTFLGGARNPLAIGMLWEEYQIRIGFLDWMIAVIPIVIIMLIIAYLVIRIFFKIDIQNITSAEEKLNNKINQLGKISLQEKSVAIIMIITIISWITISGKVGLANIAILSAVSIFIFRVVPWKEIEQYVNWGIILMYGGAIALGTALDSTKAAEWLAHNALSSVELSPFAFIIIITLVSKFLTEGISNAATVAILLPLGFALANSYNINPVIIVFSVAVPAGLAFSLPMGTPPNAICYASGYYKISDLIKAGIILNIISWAVFLIMVKIYWPLVGINL